MSTYEHPIFDKNGSLIGVGDFVTVDAVLPVEIVHNQQDVGGRVALHKLGLIYLEMGSGVLSAVGVRYMPAPDSLSSGLFNPRGLAKAESPENAEQFIPER